MKKTITIHLLSVKQVKVNLSIILPLLPKDRIEKAERYLSENDRLLSLGGSYLIEKYTGSTPILISKEGKPLKKDINFLFRILETISLTQKMIFQLELIFRKLFLYEKAFLLSL